MLTIASLTPSLTGVIALLLSFYAALAMARDRHSRWFYPVLLAVHAAASFFAYAGYSLGREGDAINYYGSGRFAFATGTRFISFVVGWIRYAADASFLDMFLVFQFFSYIGIILLHQAAAKLARDGFAVRVGILSAILLLPGFHYWTGSIGKDSLALLAYGLIAAALARERPHLALMVSGLVFYSMFRIEVVMFIVTAMALGFLPLFGRSPEPMKQIGLCAGVGALLLLPLAFHGAGGRVEGGAKVGVEEVTALLDGLHNQDAEGTTGYKASSLTPPERVFTYLFRPFFFDGGGFLGFVASIENLFLLVIFGYLCRNFSLLWRLCLASPVIRFHAIFILIFVSITSYTNYNIGLALRHKVMIYPALVLLLTAVVAYRNRLRRERRAALFANLRAEE